MIEIYVWDDVKESDIIINHDNFEMRKLRKNVIKLPLFKHVDIEASRCMCNK